MNKENLLNNLKIALEKCEVERKYKQDEFANVLDILTKEKEELVDQAILVKETDDEKYLDFSLKLQEVENKITNLRKKQEKKLKCVNVDIYLALRAYCDNLMIIYSNSVREKEEKLMEIKAQIMKNVEENKFKNVDKLTLKASNMFKEIEEINLMMNKIEKFNIHIKECETVEFEEIGKNILNGSLVIDELNNKDSKPNSDEEKKGDEPVKTDLELAKEAVEKVKQTRKFKYLKEAFEKVNKLPESSEKQELLDELEEMVNEIRLQEATRLVEKAEESLKEEDILNAKEVVLRLSDSNEKQKLLDRVNALIKAPNEEFISLLEKLTNIIDNAEYISRNEVTKLNDLYSKLESEDLMKYEKKVTRVINYYNIEVQKAQKEFFKEENVEKYGKLAFVTEFLGTALNKVLSSKLANKLRTKKIEKNSKKLENESLSDNKKDSITRRIEKASKNIADSSLVSGVRLFAARNKIASMKPVLYKEGLDEYNKQEFDSARSRLSKIINKNINKKSNDDAIKNNKDMMINVLDQYSEMLSICDDYKEKYADALLALDEFKENLDEATYNAYREQFNMIACYRKHYNDEIYELKEQEIDNIKTYYDSEEYKKSNVKTHYIK